MSVNMHNFGDRGIWVLSDCRTGPFLRSMEKALKYYYTSCSSFSSFWNWSPGLVGCFFLDTWCAEAQKCPDHRSNKLLCWKGACSRQKRAPASLFCACPLLTPDVSWVNRGGDAKLVTSTIHIRAENCIHPLLTHLCSVLDAFGIFVLFPSVPCPRLQMFCCWNSFLLLVQKAEQEPDVAEAPGP